MGCVQAKAAAPVQAESAAESPEKLPTLLRKTGTGISKIGHGIKKGAVSSVTAVGQGTTSAVTAMGNGVQQAGSGAVGAVCRVGEGAKGAVKCLGNGLTGSSSDTEVENQVEQTWYERLLSFDPWACCCQPPTDGNMLGSMVKSILANFDSSTLGVKVELGALSIDPSTGRIEVEGLTVGNPEGWSSEYLLHADRVIVDVEMEKLLYSFGKELHMEELIFDGVDVIYEKGLTTSNLNDLLKKLESDSGSAKAADQDKASDVKLVLHTILAQNIGAKLATKLTHGHGLRLEVGDLKYDDFDKEMGAGRGLMDIIRVLIMTLIKSVLATVLGKQNTKAIAGAANGVKDKFKSTGSGTVEVVKKGCFSRQGSKVSGDVSPSSEETRSQ
eukprot:CAMPEP_0197620126 /NCGR_PEP_ID=MMETSP1338-20131121/994_1 /TAXON_ID=43686 ORGANISM="Pelagodinium beii, Strain RCC1491" /NCGR_SAMPLE_ID=MMETSP1338 /ASSEMBLY_ACC=CAM_ASM_000754 /LENGTH=384 /DNA_ID=CAMNT_0043189217 /DNA_START=66 /DNA_END=1220 /DNA_ORIENTATION=+